MVQSRGELGAESERAARRKTQLFPLIQSREKAPDAAGRREPFPSGRRFPLVSSEIGPAQAVRLRAFGLKLRLPLVIGHAVDDFSGFILAERDIPLIRRL